MNDDISLIRDLPQPETRVSNEQLALLITQLSSGLERRLGRIERMLIQIEKRRRKALPK